jgi:hypothetical protein
MQASRKAMYRYIIQVVLDAAPLCILSFLAGYSLCVYDVMQAIHAVGL